MERIADFRNVIPDLDAAKNMFDSIAILEKSLAVKRAKFEKRVAEMTAALDEEMADECSSLDSLKNQLAVFIESHPAHFENPRKIKTSCGSFGLETVSAVEITDAKELIAHLLEQGYDDALKVVHTPFKPAIMQRIKAGETIPGCRLLAGDTVVIKVNRTFLREEDDAH